MFVRIFTLRFNPATDGFDNQPVEAFLADKEVLSIHDHFFVSDHTPYLALVVCYRPSAIVDAAAKSAEGYKRERRDESWRELLTEADWPLFNALRNWRNERSKQEGIPPYVICNNRQLAAMVKMRPQSMEALRRIEGFGDAKLGKYGKDLLLRFAQSTKASLPQGEPDAKK